MGYTVRTAQKSAEKGEKVSQFLYRDVRGSHDCCLPYVGVAIRPRISPTGRVAYKGTDANGTATVVEVDGSTWTAGPTGGTAPCAWDDDDTLYVLGPDEVTVYVSTKDGTDGHVINLRELYPGLVPAALGLHHIEPDGTVVLPNDPRCHGIIDGIEFSYLAIDEHGTIVGLGGGGGPHGSVNRKRPGQPVEMCVVPSDIEWPPSISLGRIVWNGIDSPAPDQQSWVPFALPAVAPLKLPESMPAIFIGGTNDKKLVRGSVAWSKAPVPDTRPVMEGTGLRSSVAGRRMFAVEWSTNLESGGLEDLTKRAIPWAKEVGCPVYIHLDNGGSMDEMDRYADALMDCAEADVHVIEAAHAVESIANLERDVAMVSVSDERPSEWGITVNYRTAGKNLNNFYRCVEKAVELARTVPNCKVIWFTGLDSCSDEMRQYVDCLVEMAAIPASLPGQQAPQPPITQPPLGSKPLPLPSQDTTGKGNDKKPSAPKLTGWAKIIAAILKALTRGNKAS